MILFKFLVSNIKNMGIIAHNFAFGNEVGVSTINLYEKDTLSSMISFQNDYLKKDFKSIEIEVKTGNSFLNDNLEIYEISLLKIDTEGFENKVLKGFDKFLEKSMLYNLNMAWQIYLLNISYLITLKIILVNLKLVSFIQMV